MKSAARLSNLDSDAPFTHAPTPRASHDDGDAIAAADLFGPLRVLVAEDDREMRTMLVRALRRDGHHVVEVEDGSALLDQVASVIVKDAPSHFDLIIAEHGMPGISGLSVLTGLRGHDWVTPFVLITSFVDPRVCQEARRLGAVVLDKPFDLQALRRVVNGDEFMA